MMNEVITWFADKTGYFILALLAAWAGAKMIAEKKINELFSQRLEVFKSEREAEIIRIKAELDTAVNRARLNQGKEFEVIPSLWEHLAETFFALRQLGPGMLTIPMFDEMDEDTLKEFIGTQDWSKSLKNEFLSARNKQNLFIQILRSEDLSDANNKMFSLERYLIRYGLFLPKSIKSLCKDFLLVSKSILAGYKVGDEVSDAEMKNRATKEFNESLKPKFEEIEASLQSLLSYRD